MAKAEDHTPVWTGDQVLGYHRIRTDAHGMILPWASDDPATAYDHVVRLVWGFWDNMAVDRNGLPYYMNHQVWRPRLDDHRGIGGDQIQMALSSWALLYQYMGNFENRAHDRIVENMKFMADWYLSHSLSPASAEWPNIPYPYNTLIYSGVYDGDMVIGHGFTQPDKAGSLGAELVTLYKITGNERYLQAAVDIADTLAKHTHAGDQDHSPLPFKVHAVSGKLGQLAPAKGQSEPQHSSYTSNWSGTLELWSALLQLRAEQQRESALMATGHSTQTVEMGDEKVAAYKQAFATVLAWMKAYPCKTNKWGPFFEDVWGWSDTQINAVTFADYIMNHTDQFENWRTDVGNILHWVQTTLPNNQWQRYGVVAINEQTAYRQPGNSHTSRQAAAELRYAELSGNPGGKALAIRRLNWATYMVDTDGKNFYPRDDVWLTDGYGDYVRHYLRAMAAAPELAPIDQDHILRSSSVITQVRYTATSLHYRSYDTAATETIRMAAPPQRVWMGDQDQPSKGQTLMRTSQGPDGWSWASLAAGGVLTVRHTTDGRVNVEK
ncbi:MAG: hypothetical protein SF187_04620 [Deltaproteobacteria bacterium]|nr:hypothetical protein [Deltaproteobacteria bacterium]